MTHPPAWAPVAAAMSEDDLLRNTVDLATALRWCVHHCRPARTEKGWRTPVQGRPGFPDFAAARSGWVLFAELKKDRGRLTTTQEEWRAELEQAATAPGSRVRYYVWRPADLLSGAIRATLTDPGSAP